MEKNDSIKNKVKIFHIMKVKNIIHIDGKILFQFDESDIIVCLGTIIDNLAISLSPNRIYPIFNHSNKTELNTYYLVNTYDYDVKLLIKDGFIRIKEEPKILKQQYDETIDWYYNEILENEKKNIIYFDKQKALRYERSR